jgi:nitrite reductase/ring-hydroxylating ferredoxin subunit
MSEEYIEVAKTSQIDDGQLMHIEISDKEILLANINGKFYAMDDRCSHMNARVSLGNISKNIVTCPFHAAKFEVTSGKNIGEPVLLIPRNGTTTTELEKIHGLRRSANVIHKN